MSRLKLAFVADILKLYKMNRWQDIATACLDLIKRHTFEKVNFLKDDVELKLSTVPTQKRTFIPKTLDVPDTGRKRILKGF